LGYFFFRFAGIAQVVDDAFGMGEDGDIITGEIIPGLIGDDDPHGLFWLIEVFPEWGGE
jgi:hypothetical protein